MNFSTYKSEEIGQVLRSLEATQDSIVGTCSLFLKLGNEGFTNRLSEDWIHYFKRFSGKEYVTKRLAMLFLANDILQKCKLSSQNPKSFLKQFEEHLREAIKIIADSKQDQLKDEIKKILHIWRERKIYPKDYLKELQTLLMDQERLEDQQDRTAKTSLPDGLVKIPSELLDYLEAEKDMKKWMDNESEAKSKLEAILQHDADDFKEDEAKFQLDTLKKSQELEHKYRTALLSKLAELQRLSDIEHTKLTHLLKKSYTLLDELDK